MSELTLFLIRFAYLAILWIFVLSAISVIRSDMFGARVPETARGAAAPAPRKQKSKPGRLKRGSPTHLIVVEGDNTGRVHHSSTQSGVTPTARRGSTYASIGKTVTKTPVCAPAVVPRRR